MVRRSTLLCCMLVMIAGTIVFVGSAIFSDDKAANRAVELVQEEDQRVGKEAYLYELKDVSYNGKEVTGTWTDEMGDRQVLRAVLPSAGTGILCDGCTITLRSYSTPVDGILNDCFYWSAS